MASLSSLATAQTLSNFMRAGMIGATLCCYDIAQAGLAGLSSWLKDEGITILFIGVPTFRHFVKTLDSMEQFPTVRLLRFTSDRATKSDFDLYKRHFPITCMLMNALGITEVGSAAVYLADHQTEIKGSIIPIGHAVQDKEILLLDDVGRELRGIATGEIAIRSQFMASGYWRDPELTRTHFIQESGQYQTSYRTGDLGRRAPDGCLTHLGRKDFRVKVRGFSVDVGEVESALLEHTGVKEAVVKGVEDPTGDRRLVGYVVPRDSTVTAAALRSFLRERLPDHMIPSHFMMMDALPLNPAGKIDRK